MPATSLECIVCGAHTTNNTPAVLNGGEGVVCTGCQRDFRLPEDSEFWYRARDLVEIDGFWWKDSSNAPTPSNEGDGWVNDGSVGENYIPGPDDDGVVGEYHAGRSQLMSGAVGGNYVGFELEVVPHKHRGQLARTILDKFGGRVERDGSLPSHGFEIISNYGNESQVLDVASQLSDILIENKARSHDTKCCGLHVHVSKNNASAYEIARMVNFWNRRENADFLKKFCRRWGSNYASALPSKGGDEITISHGRGGSKYEIVNVAPPQTIEVRGFRGTCKKSTLLACIQLANRTWEFSRDLTVCDRDMTWERFLDWVSDAPHIMDFAVEHGFRKPGKKWGKQEAPVYYAAVDMLLKIASNFTANFGEEYHNTVEAHGYYIDRMFVMQVPKQMIKAYTREVEGHADPRDPNVFKINLRLNKWEQLPEMLITNTQTRVKSLTCYKSDKDTFYEIRYVDVIRCAYPDATFRFFQETMAAIAIATVDGVRTPVACLAHRQP